MTFGVFVCGLPHSGNNVIREMLKRCGAAQCLIVHGQSLYGTRAQVEKLMREYPADAWKVVIPVRDPVCWEGSIERRVKGGRARSVIQPGTFDTYDEYRTRTRRWIAKLIADMDLDHLHVSYEAFVANPEAVGKQVVGWCGLEWAPFPTEGEGHDGPVFDANAKYREVTA